MNKSLILAALLAATSVNVYATKPPPEPPKQSNVAHGGKGGSAKSASRSTASAVSRSTQEQNVTASANGGAGGSSSNDGNAQSMNYSYSNTEALQRNNTPDMGSVLVYPTANCRVAHGGGVVMAGFGVQYGSSTPDEVCQLIELSKQLKYLGLGDPSIRIMCQEPRAAKAMGKICPVETAVSDSPEIVRP